MFVPDACFCTSGGQNQTNVSKHNSKPETKYTLTSPGSNEADVHTNYEYSDSGGNRLIIQNGFLADGMK